MANIASTIVLLNAAAPKIDDALAVLEEAYNQLDNSSRSESEQDVLMEVGSLLDTITSLQGDMQDVIDTYGDEEFNRGAASPHNPKEVHHGLSRYPIWF